MESRRTRRPTFTADERLERRREQDRRRHAERRARERREQTQARRMWMWIACGLPKPVPRSTKTTIMTVHVNPIMQAAPSQRRIISIIEASNQLLFHSQKLFFVEWIWWRINISLKSCSQSKKLQPGGKPYSFAFRNPGRPRRLINCSQDGSRTASRFAIQVNRDGRSNCSQLWSQQSPNKPCPRRGDGRRSSGQTRRRSASDGCRKGRWETWSCWQCGCIHPQLSWYLSSALIVPVGLFGWWDAAHRFLTDFSLFISLILRPDYKRIFILSW